MLKILSAILSLSLLSGVRCFQFEVRRHLNNAKELDEKDWCYVNVHENCFSEDDVAVRVSIPVSLGSSYSDVNIFFANINKEILLTSLKKNITGSIFSLPYKKEKTMVGPEVTENITEEYLILDVKFPKTWLPKNCTKISASIQSADGKIYNYYGIFNSGISIPDLMVVEEYKDYKCDSS